MSNGSKIPRYIIVAIVLLAAANANASLPAILLLIFMILYIF